MTVLVKWFLLTALSGTAIFFAETQGALSLMIQNDKSFLALGIMVIYGLMTVYVGKLAYDADVVTDKTRKELTQRANLGWFVAEHFFSLGLLGTIIGLVIATSGSLGENLPVSQIVAGLKEGLNTAFFTTICGIVFSLLLQLQLLLVRYTINK